MEQWLNSTLAQQLKEFVTGFWAALPQIAVALVILVLTWLIVKAARALVARVARSARMRRSLTEVLQMIVAAAAWIVGILIATVIVFPSMTPAKMLTALGLGSVAIGFAFKDVFENFLAGILILFREPFRLGDYIECGSIDGQVEEITIRDTHIRQTDGQRVVMPNALLFKEPVTVRTDSDFRRTTIICGVAYGARTWARRAMSSPRPSSAWTPCGTMSVTCKSSPRSSIRHPSISRSPGGRDCAPSTSACPVTRSLGR